MTRISRFAMMTGFLIAGTAAGALLYWTSQSVQQKEAALKKMQASVAQEQETIRVLHAEWDYLNRPDRLEALATKYLGLARPDAAQLDADPASLPKAPEFSSTSPSSVPPFAATPAAYVPVPGAKPSPASLTSPPTGKDGRPDE
jgi:hypothetical protein